MINRLDIYYSRKISGSGLKPVSYTASGLKPISNKKTTSGLKPISKGDSCKKIGRGLKILQ